MDVELHRRKPAGRDLAGRDPENRDPSRRAVLLGLGAAAAGLSPFGTLSAGRGGGTALAAAPGAGGGGGRADPGELAGLFREHGFTPGGPGVAVYVRQPPKLRVVDCVGMANVEAKEPITPRSVFELASVTKMMTSTAVLMLFDRGKLALTDDVRKHLPEVPAYDKQDPVRLLDMLQHVSGLPPYRAFGEVPQAHPDYRTNDDYIKEMGRQGTKVPAAFGARAKYEYNNFNYMLLSAVVERVAKKPFAAFMADELFGPAGMKSAFVYNDPAAVPARAARNDALAYKLDKGAFAAAWGLPPGRHDTLLTCGGGGVWASLRDLEAWDASLLAKPGWLKPDTAALALAPSKTKDGKTNHYGCGRGLYFTKAGKLYGFGHYGSWAGYGHMYYHDLAKRRSSVLLSNRDGFDIDKFWYALDKRADAMA